MKDRKTPMRKCVGCNQSKPKEELVRIAYYEGNLSIDSTGRAKGRGVYLCKGSDDCLNNAEKRRSFQRSFEGVTGEQVKQLFVELRGE